MEGIQFKELGQNPSYKHDIIFKLVAIGEVGVGKTAIAQRILFQNKSLSYASTLTFELLWNSYQLNDKVLCLQWWDTCGQEAYQALSGTFYKTAICAYLVYAIDNKKSFERLDFWLKHLRENASECIQVYLIGNKSDLKKREVTYQQGEQYKNDNNLDFFIETSVQDDCNLKELFNYTITMLNDIYINSCKTIDEKGQSKRSSSVSIRLRPSANSKRNKEVVTESWNDGEKEDGNSCNC